MGPNNALSLMDDSAKPGLPLFVICAVLNNMTVMSFSQPSAGALWPQCGKPKRKTRVLQISYSVKIQASWCVTTSQWSIELMETFFLHLWNVHHGMPSGCPWTQFGRQCIADTLAGSILALVTHVQCTHAHTVVHTYTLIMFLLMNYKQTLRPYTYIPVTSGLVPNDKPHSSKDKDTRTYTHTCTILLSLNSMPTELSHLHNNCTKVGNSPRNSITVHPSCMWLLLLLQELLFSFSNENHF